MHTPFMLKDSSTLEPPSFWDRLCDTRGRLEVVATVQRRPGSSIQGVKLGVAQVSESVVCGRNQEACMRHLPHEVHSPRDAHCLGQLYGGPEKGDG